MLWYSESWLTNESAHNETAVGNKELMLLFLKCQSIGIEAQTSQNQNMAELLLLFRLIS